MKKGSLRRGLVAGLAALVLGVDTNKTVAPPQPDISYVNRSGSQLLFNINMRGAYDTLPNLCFQVFFKDPSLPPGTPAYGGCDHYMFAVDVPEDANDWPFPPLQPIFQTTGGGSRGGWGPIVAPSFAAYDPESDTTYVQMPLGVPADLTGVIRMEYYNNGKIQGTDFFPTNFRSGDHNSDGYIDLFDFSRFSECLEGPNHVYPEGNRCRENHDFNSNGTVDLADFASFQQAFSPEPEPPPISPETPLPLPEGG